MLQSVPLGLGLLPGHMGPTLEVSGSLDPYPCWWEGAIELEYTHAGGRHPELANTYINAH